MTRRISSRALRGWAVAAALALVAALGGPAAAGIKVGDRAKEFNGVKTPKGKRLALKSYRGKVVVLTFGASWCKPCKKELPAYDKLAKKFNESNPDDVVFIAINIDSERENADAFLQETGVAHVRVGLDPAGGTVAMYEPETMPTTYVIDGRGIVRKVHRGFNSGDEKGVQKYVDELLAKRKKN